MTGLDTAAAPASPPPGPRQPPNGLGLGAFIVAIVAFVTGLIPVLGLLLAILAIVLAIVALRRKQLARTLAIVAIPIAAVALISNVVELGIIGAASTSSSVHSAVPAAASQAPAKTQAAPPSTQAAPSAPSATPTPADASVRTKTYGGSGDDVIRVNYTRPIVITFTCATCQGNTTLSTDSGTDTLPVNTIGSYSGRHLINAQDGSLLTKLTITADARWSVKIQDVANAGLQNLTSGATVAGHGDDVFIEQSGVNDVKVTNRGNGGNFSLQSYGSDNPLPVNEIGSYSGTVSMNGPAVVQVTSDGTWSVKGVD